MGVSCRLFSIGFVVLTLSGQSRLHAADQPVRQRTPGARSLSQARL